MLEDLAAMPARSADGKALAGDAQTWASAQLLACGRRLARAGRFAAAAATYRKILRRYPRAGERSRAQAGWIAAEVASARGSSGRLPPPTPTGSAPPGSSELVVANASPYEIEVFLQGPKPTELTVPSCSSCSVYDSEPSGVDVCAGKPSRSVTVRPGRYRAVVKTEAKNEVTPFSGSWTLGNERYRHCMFVVTSH